MLDCLKSWNSGKEQDLTKSLAQQIKVLKAKSTFAHTEIKVDRLGESTGRIDILLSAEEHARETERESPPTLVLEVGLSDVDWFQKLDQGMKYVSRMCQHQKSTSVRFDVPLLLAIVTVDKNKSNNSQCTIQIGVFLCSRKGDDDNDFRMALLRQYRTKQPKEASRIFGLLLRVAMLFQKCRSTSTENFSDMKVDEKKQSGEEEHQEAPAYQYFSANCCRVGQNVSECC